MQATIACSGQCSGHRGLAQHVRRTFGCKGHSRQVAEVRVASSCPGRMPSAMQARELAALQRTIKALAAAPHQYLGPASGQQVQAQPALGGAPPSVATAAEDPPASGVGRASSPARRRSESCAQGGAHGLAESQEGVLASPPETARGLPALQEGVLADEDEVRCVHPLQSCVRAQIVQGIIKAVMRLNNGCICCPGSLTVSCLKSGGKRGEFHEGERQPWLSPPGVRQESDVDHFCHGGAAGGLQLQPSTQQLSRSDAGAASAQYTVEEPPSPPHGAPQVQQPPLEQLQYPQGGGRCLLQVPPHRCLDIRPIRRSDCQCTVVRIAAEESVQHHHAAMVGA